MVREYTHLFYKKKVSAFFGLFLEYEKNDSGTMGISKVSVLLSSSLPTHTHTQNKDLISAITTQFKLFTGFELPHAICAAFQFLTTENFPLLIHAVILCVLELFLMSNFLVCDSAG